MVHGAVTGWFLASARAFWAEPDYWVRLLLAVGGIGVGWFTERAWARYERRGGVFLSGMNPSERNNHELDGH